MSWRNTAGLALSIALIGSVAGTPAAADPAPAKPEVYREVEDDPPAAYRARENPAARSAGARVVFGSFVSVQVNVDEFGQNIVGDAANEPSIVVNPLLPSNMVVGWRQFDTITSNFRQAGYAYTGNGGSDWTFPGSLTPGNFRSDPVLDNDLTGTLYYQSLQSLSAMDTFKSTNGGVDWSAPVPTFGGDKNWMAIDKSGGIGDGNVYGIWQAAVGCCGQDILTRSTNGGLSFETPVPFAGSPGIGTMAVGPDGELYAAGIDETVGQDLDTIVLARSTDAQDPLATPGSSSVEVDLGGGLVIFGDPNPGGLMGQVYVAADSSEGPTRGNVYVLASVDGGGADPLDVMFSRSVDGGQSWSPAIRVNDDPAGNWNWMGALSVAPNGRIDVIWNDDRASAQSNMTQLFYSYSWDAGQTWSASVAVTPTWNSLLGWPNQSKIGDYYGIVSNAEAADVAFAATFNSEQDVYYVRLFPDCNSNGVSDVTEILLGVSNDCNLNNVPDTCELPVNCGPAGRVPDGGALQGTPLRLDRLPGGELSLTWGASCIAGDTDFGVYEGTLGDFTSHAPDVCSTGGSTSAQITPGPGDTYYLIVPRNGANEGSYGSDSGGANRPAAVAPCRPQSFIPCFGS